MITCIYVIDEWVCVFWRIISLEWKKISIKLKRTIYTNTFSGHSSAFRFMSGRLNVEQWMLCTWNANGMIDFNNQWMQNDFDGPQRRLMVFSSWEKTVWITTCAAQDRRIHLKWWFRRRPTAWNHATRVCPVSYEYSCLRDKALIKDWINGINSNSYFGWGVWKQASAATASEYQVICPKETAVFSCLLSKEYICLFMDCAFRCLFFYLIR